MYNKDFPKLDQFAFLAVSSNRSKSYLQNLIRNGYKPSNGIILESDDIKLPEHTANDQNFFSEAKQTFIHRCASTGIWFDEKEHIVNTLKKNNIPYYSVQTLDVNDREVVNAVKLLKEKYIVYAGPGGNILKNEILGLGKLFLHVHPGWLPTFKGSTTIYYSLLANKQPACSVIILTQEIDNGPIFYRREFDITNITDLDYIFDPCIRAAALIDFFNENYNNYLYPIDISNDTNLESSFYIIHPLLKHIAILNLNERM